jgi:acyl-CoA thioesterase FadM
MMTVRLRIAAMLARHLLFGRKAAPVATSRLALRCVWTDCDVNGHMNNSRYLAIMDLGRWHYMLATGLGKVTLRRRWAPVAVRVEIDDKKSIKPGDRFELETEPVAASARSVTIRQRFWLRGELAADAKVVVLFVHRGEVQPLEPLFEELPIARPPAPSALDDEVGQREAAHVGE